jgi:hypothetical protein
MMTMSNTMAVPMMRYIWGRSLAGCGTEMNEANLHIFPPACEENISGVSMATQRKHTTYSARHINIRCNSTAKLTTYLANSIGATAEVL